MNNENVLKMVAKKFPTCTLIDSTEENGDIISAKCNKESRYIIVGNTKKRPGWDVKLCTGNFNVYVLDINPRSENVE